MVVTTTRITHKIRAHQSPYLTIRKNKYRSKDRSITNPKSIKSTNRLVRKIHNQRSLYPWDISVAVHSPTRQLYQSSNLLTNSRKTRAYLKTINLPTKTVVQNLSQSTLATMIVLFHHNKKYINSSNQRDHQFKIYAMNNQNEPMSQVKKCLNATKTKEMRKVIKNCPNKDKI